MLILLELLKFTQTILYHAAQEIIKETGGPEHTFSFWHLIFISKIVNLGAKHRMLESEEITWTQKEGIICDLLLI